MPLLAIEGEEKTYGPYLSTTQGRYIVVTKRPSGTTSMLYSKWLMGQHLGLRLGRDEHVHHRNENKLDDRIENLEVKEASKHLGEHNPDPEMGTFVCPGCGDPFERLMRKVRWNQRDGRPGPFCGRRCAGRSNAGA